MLLRTSFRPIAVLLLTACMQHGQPASSASPARTVSAEPGEKHFRSISQITFGGENAEAYFSHDGQWLTLPEHT